MLNDLADPDALPLVDASPDLAGPDPPDASPDLVDPNPLLIPVLI